MTTIVTRAGKAATLSWNEVDANFTNLNTDKAELASPTFTGTPAAPTAAVGTNTTQVATTAFVNSEISNNALLKSGGTATGQIKGITPVSAEDLTRKDYVDTMLPKAGGTVTGQIKGITPVANEDLARKDYVDNKLSLNGPAFYASGAGTATTSGSTTTQTVAEIFDTNSAYTPSTGVFNPQVAGYYSLSVYVNLYGAASVATHAIYMYKNGSAVDGVTGPTVMTYQHYLSYTTLVLLNGTSDSITFRYYQNTSASVTPASVMISGCLVRI